MKRTLIHVEGGDAGDGTETLVHTVGMDDAGVEVDAAAAGAEVAVGAGAGAAVAADSMVEAGEAELNVVTDDVSAAGAVDAVLQPRLGKRVRV